MNTASTPILSVRNLSKRFDMTQALKEVSLEQLETEISTILEGGQVGRVLVKVS